MKRIKKFLASLMVAVMVLTAAPLSGFAGLELNLDWLDFSTKASAATYNGTCGSNLTWSLDTTTGKIVISGTGSMESYSYYNYNGDVPWTLIESYIKTVIVEDGVTSIGSNAFYDIDSITSVELPDTLKTIGENAFGDCDNLTNINFPDSLVNVYDYAFEGCESLKSVTLSNNMVTIPRGMFLYCPELTSVTIPESVLLIRNDAFSVCGNLTEVYYKGSETQWANVTVENGNDLILKNIIFLGSSDEPVYTSGTCGENLTWSFDTQTGELVISGTGAMSNYTYPEAVPWYDHKSSIKTVIIEDGVTSISGYTFKGYTELTSVSFSNSVTSIGTYAFSGCTGIANAMLPNGITSIDAYTFEDCTALTSISIPDSVTNIGTYAFDGCTALTSILIPDSVTNIGACAFKGCVSLESVTLPNNLIEIPASMFSGCTGLESIVIPESVVFIRASAFSGCESLSAANYCGTKEKWERVTVASGNNYLLNSIIIDAFSERPIDKMGTCGSSVDWVLYTDGELVISGSGALSFSWSKNPWADFKSKIKTLTIESGITSIQSGSFKDFVNLTTVSISKNVTSIGYSAFENCTSLKSVTIPAKVRVIEAYLFRGCTSLESVTVLGNINRIEAYAFSGTALPFENGSIYINNHLIAVEKGTTGSYTVREGTVGIAGSAFTSCKEITSVTIPDGVTYIGDFAFSGCTELADVIIPAGVTYIGDNAFATCHALTSVTVPEGCFTIEDEAFSSCKNLKEVRLPKSINYIGIDALYTGYRVLNIYYPGTPEQWKNVSVIIGSYEMNDYDYLIFECDSARPYYSPYTCGSNIKAKLYVDGELLIEGTGAMTNPNYDEYYNNYMPWYSKSLRITSITISDGITSIVEEAFYGCSNLTSVTIPGSVKAIKANAFKDCTSLKTVYFDGTQEEWQAIGYNNWTGTAPEIIFKDHEHVYTERISVKPTCTSSGEKLYTCFCGESYSEMIFATGHSFENYVQEPTCKADGGYTCFKCTVCGEETLRQLTEKLEHTPGEWVTERAPSCTAVGLKVKRCIACREELEKIEIPSNGHTYTQQVITSPTCGKEGLVKSTCTTCGNVVQESISATEEHILTLARKEPTCDTYGAEYHVCTVCGNLCGETVIIEKTEHIIGDWVTEIEVSCTEDGLNVKKCTSCGEEFDRQVVEKLGHTPGKWKNKIKETCTSTGLRILPCTVCSAEIETEVIPMVDHNYKYYQVITAATCDKDGVGRYTCSVCYDSYEQTILATGEHTHTLVRTEPTCTSVGTEYTMCDVCDIVLSDTVIIEKLEHTPGSWVTAFEATCNLVGLKVKSCDSCGIELERQVIEKLEHTGEWFDIVPATSTQSGSRKRTCTMCSTTETFTIPQLCFTMAEGVEIDFANDIIYGLGVGLDSIDSYATPFESSYVWEYETNDGAFGTGAKAILKDGETVLGEYTIVIFGDTDGDGWYDGMDAVLVSCFVNGLLTKDDVSEAVYMAADCNHDGVVDNDDSLLLRKAGILKTDIDQSKSAEELQADSAYIEYLDLIDQTPEIEIEEVEPTPEETPEQGTTQVSIWDMILTFIKSIFEFILSYIPMPLK